MTLADLFHRIATGPKRRRSLLTPLGLVAFASTVAIVIVGGVLTDRVLRLPALLPGPLGPAVGGPVVAAGALLTAWCVVRFWRARGTPVPMNPPEELILDGPYAIVRNPMVTGVLATLFGLGVIVHSVGITFVWTPAYLLMHWIELTRVEEPELTRRFGDAYREYQMKVPRFIPRLRQWRVRRTASRGRRC